MLRLSRDYPVPELKRIRRKADFSFDIFVCVAIGHALGRLMDGGFWGITPGSLYGPSFYAYAVPIFVAVWAALGAYGQHAREEASVEGYREVGVSGKVLGWRFFMSQVPSPADIDENVTLQAKQAEKTIYRALRDKKGYLSLRGRARHAVTDWLDMTFLADVDEKEREWIPRWVCWRVLRDNHCG